MPLRPAGRRVALTAHVTSSLGWFGAVVAFLVLAVAGRRSGDDATVRAAYVGMDLTARYAIVPLAVAALLTGLVSSLGSPWGLLRHYWVITKLVLVVVATAVLLLQLPPIAALAAQATAGAGLDAGARLSAILHAAGGLAVLLGATVLAVWKPRGTTRYAHRTRGA